MTYAMFLGYLATAIAEGDVYVTINDDGDPEIRMFDNEDQEEDLVDEYNNEDNDAFIEVCDPI